MDLNFNVWYEKKNGECIKHRGKYLERYRELAHDKAWYGEDKSTQSFSLLPSHSPCGKRCVKLQEAFEIFPFETVNNKTLRCDRVIVSKPCKSPEDFFFLACGKPG